jgi:hypothetical protein
MFDRAVARPPTHTAAAPVAGRRVAARPAASPDLGSPGAELGHDERRHFEAHFRRDLSAVRVHTGPEADRSARALGAQAYAIGTDVVFAAGRYAPDRPAGRALLAHELTHVVQQADAGTRCIQRAPDDNAPPDAGVTPDVAPPLDADANEAAARAQNPQLPVIDRDKQTPQQNEDAVRAVLMAAFGTEDALNAAFETLAPSVRSEVDKYAGTGPGAVTANRAQFFVRMRLYFDSWGDVLAHFRYFRRVNRGPVDVVLHADAAARLERALDVLAKHGHAFPSIGVGFGLRGFHQGEFQTQGYMIHALGYAVDVAAAENPKIAFMKPGAGAEKHDPIQIAASIDPSGAHMDLGPSNPATIEAMGKRTAADSALAAAEDTDPVAKEYFERFEQQFQQMQAGSLGFLGTITKVHRDQLLQLRSQYFEVLKALAAERKKGTKADAKVLGGLEAQRRKVLAAMPALMTEWIAGVDAEIAKTLKAHPGMDKLRSPAEISKDLAAAEATLKQAAVSEAQAQAAKTRAIAERDVASEAKRQAQARERLAPAGKEFKKALDATAAARQKLDDKVEAVVAAIDSELATRSALAGATEARGRLAQELKRSDDPKLQRAWAWVTSLRELRQALSAPDLTTPVGVKAFERLTTGDLQRVAPVDNPPLLRLLEAGFFNPKGAFDLAFFEEMAHSGFWPGATWGFGGADPMHFELLEGRNRIRSPGNSKLKPLPGR